MITRTLFYVGILFSVSTKIVSMDGPMFFAFVARIQNMSKSPITYTRCWGDYSVSRELDSQEIPCNCTLPIVPNKNGGIFKLKVADKEHSIINCPDIVSVGQPKKRQKRRIFQLVSLLIKR